MVYTKGGRAAIMSKTQARNDEERWARIAEAIAKLYDSTVADQRRKRAAETEARKVAEAERQQAATEAAQREAVAGVYDAKALEYFHDADLRIGYQKLAEAARKQP